MNKRLLGSPIFAILSLVFYAIGVHYTKGGMIYSVLVLLGTASMLYSVYYITTMLKNEE